MCMPITTLIPQEFGFSWGIVTLFSAAFGVIRGSDVWSTKIDNVVISPNMGKYTKNYLY